MPTRHPSEPVVFLGYINNFRAIATLFVVFNHSVPALDWTGDDQLSRLIKIVFTNGAVLFTFIAGFLFQHLVYKFDYRTYLIARFKLVVTPYLILSLPAVLTWTFLYQKTSLGIPADFYSWSSAMRILYLYVTGLHLAPVWFIPMIVLFYLAAPVFHWFDRCPRAYWILPALMLLSYIVPRHWNPVIAFVHFLSIYVFGMFCSRYKQQVLPLTFKYLILLVVLFAVLVVVQWLYTHEVQGYINYWIKLIVCVATIAVLARYDDRVGGPFKAFAAINFSVFFLHSYVLAGIKILIVGRPATSLPIDGSVINHLLFASAVVLISVLITLPLRKVTGKYSRHIIGS